jgi:ribosome maturation factor RimP
VRREELADLAEEVLAEEAHEQQGGSFELVECSISRTHRSQTFRVSIDRVGGVSVEDCARVSRKISLRLDGNPLLHGAYQLEVSSAGMNRPIWSAEHFARYEGEPVLLELTDQDAKPRFVHGTIGPLETGDSPGVWILPERGERFLAPLPLIARANLRMDPWRAARRKRAEADENPGAHSNQGRPSNKGRPEDEGRQDTDREDIDREDIGREDIGREDIGREDIGREDIEDTLASRTDRPIRREGASRAPGLDAKRGVPERRNRARTGKEGKDRHS